MTTKDRYTAKVYFDDKEIIGSSGNDLEELIAWMLLQSEGKFGNYSGEIIDNETNKVVQTFRRTPPE